ncbi:MAG: neutral/alkaline non-lysosomal ceramidase N-terminal domain-containing protein [Deltaproteobacteria bacterium]|nr:neutral/alkaline non-lysosomal ceramidase N-terminal domain-containing protein [Deltaproteobacteria bacterium]
MIRVGTLLVDRFRYVRLIGMFALLLIIIIGTGCGGGGNSDNISGGSCAVVVGKLIVDETVNGDSCGWEARTAIQVYEITQNNCDITVKTNAGLFTGIVEGSELSWTGDYPYEEGTMSITSLDLSLSGDTVEGTSSWTWSDGVSSCSGTNQISGVLEAASSITELNPPSSLIARAITSTLINLSWTDRSDNESGFIIERSSISETTGFDEITTVAANVTSFDDAGLEASTRYWYRVSAGNSAGNAGYSNTDNTATPAPPAPVPLSPSNLVATATSSASVSLNWTDHTEHENGFIIERRGVSEESSFEEIAGVVADVTEFDDEGLDALTTYWYRVSAYNSAGNSGYSNADSATTSAPPVVIPLRPSNFVATATSSSTINLTWSDQSSNESGFIIERSSMSGTTGFAEIATVSADVVAFDDTGLNASTQYWYRVSATNSAGNSAYSNVGSAVTWDLDCTVPSNCAFLIGAGVYDVTGPAAELGMMGYAKDYQRTTGIHTRLYSRAYVIGDVATNKRVLFVSADLLFITQSVSMGVLEKLQAKYGNIYTKDNVMLTATHTHGGPGGYSGYALYDFSIRGFDRQNYNAIVDGIYQSIVRAHDNLGPGKIKINQGDLFDTGFNRSETAYSQNLDKADYTDSIDTQMQLLRLERPDGKEIGMINWFALHPTSIGNTNRYISSDNKGYASFYFEKSKGTSYQAQETFVGAFAQSNAGDVIPNLWGYPDGVHDYERMEIIGEKLLNKASELYDNAETYLKGTIDYRHRFLDFSKNGSIINDGRACVGAMGLSFAGGSHEDGLGIDIVPEGFIYGINWPEFTLLPEDQACQKEKVILLPTGRLLPYPWTPDILPIQILRIGNLALVGLPVEATTMTGRRMREAVQVELTANGVDQVVFAGYANAYGGYITTAEEFATQQYEGASTLFGPNTEQVFREEVVELAQSMRDGTAVSPGPNPPDMRDATVSFILGVIFDDKPLFKNFGDLHLNANTTYNRGDTVKVMFWGGHPKNNLRTQDTFLKVQKKEGGDWVTIATDNDPETRYIWQRNFIAYSLITTEWDIPLDAEPGDYKIVHYGDWKSGWTGAISEYSGESGVFTVK